MPNPTIKIDLITADPLHNEYVMYLVEDSPWDIATLDRRMDELTDRIYGAIEVACLGLLARKYPEAKGGRVRLQIDLHGVPPAEFSDRVNRLVVGLNSDEQIAEKTANAHEHISGLRFETRRTMGRA